MEQAQTRNRLDFDECLLDYATRIARVSEELPNSRLGNFVAQELLISGTSPMPALAEARAAANAKGYIDKMAVALLYLRASYRWLNIIKRTSLVNKSADLDPLIQDTDQLIRIFFGSIRTAQERQEDRQQSREDKPRSSFRQASPSR